MKDVLSHLQNLISTAEVSKDNISKLKKARDKAVKALGNAKLDLSGARDSKLADQAFEESFFEVKSVANHILKEEIQLATTKSSEYSYPEFKRSLFAVADNDNVVEFVFRGSGWSKNISVLIDMDSYAGNINDYAESVEYARNALKVKETRDPKKASEFWRKKVWGTSLYQKTIKKRFEGMNDQAPFWSLLNYGTATASMSSSIGGTPYPRVRGTRFKEHAEDKIYRYFRQLFTKKRSDNKQLRDELKERVNQLEMSIKESDALLNQLEVQFENFSRAQNVAKKIGVSIKDSDVDRLIEAIDNYRSGNKSKSRISVGGKRFSVSKLAGLDY